MLPKSNYLNIEMLLFLLLFFDFVMVDCLFYIKQNDINHSDILLIQAAVF